MIKYTQSVSIDNRGHTKTYVVGEQHKFFDNAATVTEIYPEDNEIFIRFDDNSLIRIHGYPYVFQSQRVKE